MSPEELRMLADWLLDLGMMGCPVKLSDAEKAIALSRKIREKLPNSI